MSSSRLSLPRRTIAAVAVLSTLSGAVVAAATSDDPGRDPAPPRARGDVPGVVSIGRPIAAFAAGSPAAGEMIMRVREPDGTRGGVLFFEHTRRRDGRSVRERCFEVGPERALRRYPVGDGGSCIDARFADLGEPWGVSVSSQASGPVRISGVTTPRVRRLTVAGPGGTFEVPRARGAFVLVYGDRASGRVVLSATLRDGSKRYFRTSVPPSSRPDGAAAAADPGGLPAWYATAATRTYGPRRGQTCVSAHQETDLRAAPGRRGGNLVAPACGELSRAAVFVRTVRTGRGDPSTFSLGRLAARRTVLTGAAAANVRTVVLVTTSGRRTLELANAGKAFIAVLAADVEPEDLAVEVTLADGTVHRIDEVTRFNRATSENPPPRLRGPVDVTLGPPGSRRVVLRARLTGPAKRFEITFLGREIRMGRSGGTDSAPRYAGVYDGTRGVRRDIPDAGERTRFGLLLCGATCRLEGQRQVVRGP